MSEERRGKWVVCGCDWRGERVERETEGCVYARGHAGTHVIWGRERRPSCAAQCPASLDPRAVPGQRVRHSQHALEWAPWKPAGLFHRQIIILQGASVFG